MTAMVCNCIMTTPPRSKISEAQPGSYPGGFKHFLFSITIWIYIYIYIYGLPYGK